MITNRYGGPCRKCGGDVPPQGGFAIKADGGWVVEHNECPTAEHNPTGAPTWGIGQGEGYGGLPYTPGSTLRAEWWSAPGQETTAPQDPQDVLGGVALDRRISGIVTVVTASSVYYREDGMSFGVGDERGYFYSAQVRVATAEEAASILAAEEKARRRDALASRAGALFGARGPMPDDAELPEQADPTGLPVPLDTGRSTGRRFRTVRVDAAEQTLWLIQYNGADGDDWSASNAGSSIAWRMPLTPERAELVAELRGEYEIVNWTNAGFGEDPARVLITAGWAVDDSRFDLSAFKVETADDARALLDRTPEWWKEAGWWHSWVRNGTGHRFPPADAARLADAGIAYATADDHYVAGLRTVDEMIKAAAPAIPDDATRIVIAHPRPGSLYSGFVTDDVEIARAWLDRNPDHWKLELVAVDTGPRVVHVAEKWSLWDDGSLVVSAYWGSVYDEVDGVRVQRVSPAPRSLSDAAVSAINLGLGATNKIMTDRSFWHPLRDAVEHSTAVVDSWERGGTGSGSSGNLIRHDIQLADGSTVTLWQAKDAWWGWAGGDADYEESYSLHTDESSGRSAYREAKSRK